MALSGVASKEDGRQPRPFTYNGETFLNSRRELIKVIVSIVFLVPFIRLATAFVCVVLQWLLSELVMISWTPVYSKDNLIEPMTGWRLTLMGNSSRILSRMLMACFGVWNIKTKGALDPSARVVVSNHITVLDAFLLMSQFSFTAVAKKDMERVPFFGRMCQAMQYIFVDRRSTSARADALSEISKRAQHGGFPPILIFPEGTTSNGKTLMVFKKGAFATGSPVQSVIIKFPWEHSDPCWTNRSPSMWISVLQMLCQPYQDAEVIFLPVRRPSKAELSNPERYAENVRKTMAQALNVPTAPYGADDSIVDEWLLERGECAELDISISELRERFKVKLEQIKSLIRDFDRIDVKGDRFIDREEFEGFLTTQQLSLDSDFANRMFTSFVSNGNNSSRIGYGEFILGALTLNGDDDLSEKAVFSFSDALRKSWMASKK